METLISLLIWILVLGVIWAIFHFILTKFPLDPPMRQIIEVVIAVIFLIIVLSWFVGWIPAPRSIMIDLYYFMVMAVALLWIWGFNYAFKQGEILRKSGRLDAGKMTGMDDYTFI